MTLGGLALAVGILVDDATVTIENIHRNIDQGKEIVQAILDGASQIAVPALVSTLSICIVFVPMFFLSGCSPSICSCRWRKRWCLRCWLPTCCRGRWCRRWRGFCWWRRQEKQHVTGAKASPNPFVRMQAGFERGFERFRERYREMLESAIRHRKLFVVCFFPACVLSFALLPFVGQDFFPTVDSGEFKLHLRAPTGTRIEDTADLVQPSGRRDPERNPASRTGRDHRQHRPAVQRRESGVQQLGADRAGRCRHSSGTDAEAPPDSRSTSRNLARNSARIFPV